MWTKLEYTTDTHVTREQSKQLVAIGESAPKKKRRRFFRQKRYCDSRFFGIVKEQSLSTFWKRLKLFYFLRCWMSFNQVKWTISAIRPQKSLFLHKNPPAHSSAVLDTKLMELCFELCRHAPPPQNWLLQTITCFVIWKNSWGERNFIQTRMLLWTWMYILRDWTNPIIRMGLINWSSVK